MGAEEFFELVQRSARVQDISEQIRSSRRSPIELERDHGFVFVSDERLVAAVNVSTEEEDNFLADLEVELADGRRRR